MKEKLLRSGKYENLLGEYVSYLLVLKTGSQLRNNSITNNYDVINPLLPSGN